MANRGAATHPQPPARAAEKALRRGTEADRDIEARKRIAREVFGRELTTEQVRALGPRIDAAVRNVAILAAWENRRRGHPPAGQGCTEK